MSEQLDQDQINKLFALMDKQFASTIKKKKVTFACEPKKFIKPKNLVIDNLDNHLDQDNEIELRFGHFVQNRFVSTVPKTAFYNLLSFMQKRYPTVKPIQSVVTITPGEKKIRMIKTGNKIHFETKSRIKNFDYLKYGTRLAVNKEEIIDDKDDDELQFFKQQEFEHARKRTRYTFENGNRQWDLTIVVTAAQISYEVEIEYHPKFFKKLKDNYKKQIDQDAKTTLSVMYKTADGTLRQQNLDILINNFNCLLDQVVGNVPNSFRKAKTIRVKQNGALDVVNLQHIARNNKNYFYQGRFALPKSQKKLVDTFYSFFKNKNKNIFSTIENKPVSFSYPSVFSPEMFLVTPKLDGERVRLFFDENGVFIVEAGTRYAQKIAHPIHNDSRFKLVNTIIDAESYKGSYYPFDLLVFDSQDMRNMPFTQRMSEIEKIGFAKLAAKPFFTGLNFFDAYAKCVEFQENSDLEFDGQIVQPEKPPYKNRNTMKIKPLDEMTVDLLTKMDENGRLSFFAQGKNGLVEKNVTFDEHIKYKKILDEKPTADFIAEYYLLEETPWLKFKKYRQDKPTPNFTTVVDNVRNGFYNIKVTESDLLGKTLVTWRKWANKNKRFDIHKFVYEKPNRIPAPILAQFKADYRIEKDEEDDEEVFTGDAQTIKDIPAGNYYRGNVYINRDKQKRWVFNNGSWDRDDYVHFVPQGRDFGAFKNQYLSTKAQSVALDIGVGRGGTLLPLTKKVDKVYGIDVSQKNLDELEKRVESDTNWDDFEWQKVELAVIGGEETDKVVQFVQDPVQTVLLMYSISFFYESDEKLQQLVDTISAVTENGANVIIHYMDGTKVKPDLVDKVIETDLYKIVTSGHLGVGNKLEITLKTEDDPIFKHQKEWIVDIDHFGKLMKKEGFKKIADRSLFNQALPKDNKTFSKYNSVAVYKKSVQVKKNEIHKFVMPKVGEIRKITLETGETVSVRGVPQDADSFFSSVGVTRKDVAKKLTKGRYKKMANVSGTMAYKALYSRVNGKPVDKKNAEKEGFKLYKQMLVSNEPVGHELLPLIGNYKVINEKGIVLRHGDDGAILKIGDSGYLPIV